MIISLSGRMQSGKDLTARIIQYLTSSYNDGQHSFDDYLIDVQKRNDYPEFHKWQVKKFATSLKQVASILTGIPVEDFEKIEVKNSILGSDWNKFHFQAANGELTYIGVKSDISIHDKHGYGTYMMTVRELLQKVGTEAIRNHVHPDAWVNALFANYKPYFLDYDIEDGKKYEVTGDLPKWIITDVRFENEAKAVEDRGGILIRVNRPKITTWHLGKHNVLYTYIGDKEHVTISNVTEDQVPHLLEELEKELVITDSHISETALDGYDFDYTISNDGDIPSLVEKVREILIKEKII